MAKVEIMSSDISHVFYSEKEGFTGFRQPYDVLGSMTVVVTSQKEHNE
jgi:hypothetical protein